MLLHFNNLMAASLRKLQKRKGKIIQLTFNGDFTEEKRLEFSKISYQKKKENFLQKI